MSDQAGLDRRLMIQEAVRTIDDLRARLEVAESSQTTPIAITGIGCRYPGGVHDLTSFWELLSHGVDAITEVPPDRWALSDWFDSDPLAPGKMSTRWGGFLDAIDHFDAEFFGIAPREAIMLDPQHRILLEVAVEALEHAGCPIDRLGGTRTGVFIGMTMNEYHQHLLRSLPAEALSPYLATGNVMNAAAGRIAYTLGVHGPSVAIDTACSSSLTAIHLACQSLRTGDCETALAGGVNIVLAPQTSVMFSKWGMMAADGRCKAFDAAADGFVRSEGCAILVLKRLDVALAAGDRVLAVIEGSAINQDGRSSGLTVPNGLAQEALIRQAHDNAGITPADIDYVEAHGTGTALGDPIEVDALAAVFSTTRDATQPLRIGSVKTNFGHTEAASGIAGLIKCVLALDHEMIPPHLHVKELTPEIDWERLAISVVTTPSSWPRAARRRRAGVSSFGFSGANAHVILAEPPLVDRDPRENRRLHQILGLSARDPLALRTLASRYASALRHPEAPALGDICSTANAGRAQFNHRLFVCGKTHQDLAEALSVMASGEHREIAGGTHAIGDKPKVAFLFTGQGSQYVGMGQQLYKSQPAFREAMDRCAAILVPHLDRPLIDLVFRSSPDERLLDQTSYTQPALFALEWSLAELWRSLGVTPAAMLGHSLGEYVAACQAGVMSLEDGLRIVAKRAALMQALPRDGMMAAVGASESTVERFIAPYATSVAIAAINGPQNVVISGRTQSINAIIAALEANGLSALPLAVSHAFHSPSLDPILDRLEALAGSAIYHRPTVSVVSNVSGRIVEGEDLVDAGYWRRHARAPVRFSDSVDELRRRGCNAFIEIGPSPVLTTMGRKLGGDKALWLPSLARGRDDEEQLLQSVGSLFVAGSTINWAGLDGAIPQRRCALPSYPFQRKRFWFDPDPSSLSIAPQAKCVGLGSLIQSPVSPLVSDVVFSLALSQRTHPWLADHIVAGEIVVPMTAFVLMARDAARRVLTSSRVVLEDIVLAERATLQSDATLPMQIVLSPASRVGEWTFKVIGLTAERPDGYILHASGRANSGLAETDATDPRDLSADMTVLGADDHFDAFLSRGIHFGPAFQGVVRVHCRPGAAWGEIEHGAATAQPGDFAAFTPGLLDVCLQPLIHAWPISSCSKGFLPFSIERLDFFDAPAAAMDSFCRARMPSLNADTMTGDVVICDNAGKTLVRVQGLTVRGYSVSDAKDGVGGLIYERLWKRVASDTAMASVLAGLSMSEVTDTALRKRPAHLAGSAASGYSAAAHALEARARDFIIRALLSLGWSAKAGDHVGNGSLATRLGVKGSYKRLLSRFMTILGEAGYCVPEHGGWTMRRTLACEASRDGIVDFSAAAGPEFRLLERCGAHLAAVLKGDTDPLDLLFAPEMIEDLETIYSGSLTTKAMNEIAADVVVSAAKSLGQGQTLRILEIGAGSGGTTAHILEHLPPEQVQYCFTDIGTTFLGRARTRFADHSFITYEVLDIERDLASQGFANRRFDVVIAANVLHATCDLAASLTNVHDLLQPGGLAVLIEGTRRQSWIDVTFGLTDGWWKFTDTSLRGDYPLLSAEDWIGLLETKRFSSSLTLDGPAADGQASDYSVLVTRKATQPLVEEHASWLLFAADDGQAVESELHRHGQRCITVLPGPIYKAVGPNKFYIRPGMRADYELLLADISTSGRACCGIAHMWCVDEPFAATPLMSDLKPDPDWRTGTLLHLAQALASRGAAAASNLWMITRGAQAVSPDIHSLDPDQAPVWGFAKVLGLEHPEFNIRRLDLDPSAPSRAREARDLVELILNPSVQAEYALRGEALYEPELRRWTVGTRQPVRLVATESGRLDSLEWQTTSRRNPGPGEVEIEVEAAGLNFRDVLSVLNMYSVETSSLGGEVSGTVVALGSGVTHLALGDAVGAIAFGGFSSFVTTHADLTLKKPLNWSFADITTVPAAFATAYHALVQLAGLRRGERVLLHAASGGVGLAALKLAQNLGCEIIATAGSDEKRDFLRAAGVTHVFDSRSLSFAEDIKALLPRGAGVDVILNTLAGDFVDASLSVLGPYGRFVELGRRELWNASHVATIRPSAQYFGVDLATIAQTSPEAYRSIFEVASRAIAEGSLVPLPHHIFPAEETQNAFRLMAQAKHVGKVVVVPPRRSKADVTARFVAAADGAYLITGGLSGLGLRTAEWLAERGAKYLALFGRSAPDANAEKTIAALRASGVKVVLAQGDVAVRHDVDRLLAELRITVPPLRGIIHSAGVLDDCTIIRHSWPRIQDTMRPKVAGAWNLHTASIDLPLDFFICYSSASAILGSPGQASHAAANAYMDALAHHRRALGLPALSINWGAWSDIGAAAGAKVTGQVARFGIEAITPSEGIAALERLLLSGIAQATVARVDWDRFLDSKRPAAELRAFAKLSKTSNKMQRPESSKHRSLLPPNFKTYSAGNRRDVIVKLITTTMIEVLGLGPDARFEPHQALRDLGLDSLMSVDLRNRLQLSVDQTLPATLAFDFPTFMALVDHVCDLIVPSADKHNAPSVTHSDDDLGEPLAALMNLSATETEALLIEELARAREVLR